MKPFRVGFCVSGGGRLFRAAGKHASHLGITPAVVVAETKSSPDLAGFCAEEGIPFHLLDPKDKKRFHDELSRICLNAQLDLLCLTFDRIIQPPLVAHFRKRMINVHMGLLPAFPGKDAVGQAAGFGVRFAGATIHEVTEEVDAGPIIAQCVLSVRRGEQAESIGRRLFNPLRSMFLQVLAWYAAGRVIRDDAGRVWIKDAVYGEFPISPAVEEAFSD